MALIHVVPINPVYVVLDSCVDADVIGPRTTNTVRNDSAQVPDARPILV